MSETSEALVVRREALRLREYAPIFDIPLRIVIEVGRLRLRVRDIGSLTVDTVLELKKAAGEPFDVYINGTPVARGEIMIVEQSTGLRIVEVNKPGGMA